MTNAWKHFIENVKLRRFTVLLLIIVVLMANEINDEFNFIYVYSYLPCC